MFNIKKKYVIIILLIFLLIFVQYKIPSTYRPIKGLLGNILNPFLYLVDSTADFVNKTLDNYIFLINVKQNNIQLENKIQQLELENSILKEKVKELERLKKLLNFKEAYKFDTVAANVIGRNNSGFIKYLIIDMGSKDGIKIDLPVISSKGLVGKIVDVYRSSAKVKVILDKTLKVSVINFNSRETGVASGSDNGLIVVDFYSNLGQVNIGDLFITSGLGMLYPKGIPVGLVVKIETPDYGLFKKVYLRPLVDFNKLENVLVIITK